MSSIATTLIRLPMGAASRLRNLYYRAIGVRIHGYIWMRAVEIPRNFACVQLDRCSLDRGVVLLSSGPEKKLEQISIGNATYINRNTFIDSIDSIVIGRNVAIGPGCYITDHDHGDDPSLPPLQQEMYSIPVRIEDNVWIGANVVILKGVTIGPRTIIGAGSVVTKSLPADVVAVGVPAKVIKSRAALPT